MELKQINSEVSVSPQISEADIETIKAAGFVAIVNNRPDGEEPGQPEGTRIEAVAKAHGLAYHAIPLGRDGVSPELIERTASVLEQADGPVFCYCRSGTRSTTLWALSQAGKLPTEEIIAPAHHAGYDISHLAGHLGARPAG